MMMMMMMTGLSESFLVSRLNRDGHRLGLSIGWVGSKLSQII